MRSVDSSTVANKTGIARNGGGALNGRREAHLDDPNEAQLEEILSTLVAASNGEFSARVAIDGKRGRIRQIAQKINRMVELNESLSNEIIRVERAVRRDGRMTETASLRGVSGGWSDVVNSVNSLISGLVQPSTEVARVI